MSNADRETVNAVQAAANGAIANLPAMYKPVMQHMSDDWFRLMRSLILRIEILEKESQR